VGRSTCMHTKAKFFAVQKFGNGKSVKLYNCPECKSTVSERTLREARRAVVAAR